MAQRAKPTTKLQAARRKPTIWLAAALCLLLIGATLLGIGLSVQQRAPQATASGQVDSRPPTASGSLLAYAKPVELQIPAIGVDSRLAEVGKQPDGSIGVPLGSQLDHAAWYKYSPAPGQAGAAIIVGHVDTIENGPSVFYDLGELKPGETITVRRADGIAAHFTIYAVRQYAKQDFPTLTVYGSAGRAELRLITCSGDYDRQTHHYLKNTIVFARLDIPPPNRSS